MPSYDIKRVIVNSSMMELSLWGGNDKFLKFASNYNASLHEAYGTGVDIHIYIYVFILIFIYFSIYQKMATTWVWQETGFAVTFKHNL